MWPVFFRNWCQRNRKDAQKKEIQSVNMDNKNVESNLVNTRRFWNNLHQVISVERLESQII